METPENLPSPTTAIARGAQVIREKVATLTSGPGVYQMLGENAQILYVGKARNLPDRVAQYAQIAQQPYRIQRMVQQVQQVEIVRTRSEAEALLLEAALIKKHKPRYNIQLRDDKSFPYIHLSGDHAFPRISKYRGSTNVEGKLFGPYVSASSVDESIALLQKAFLLRPCSDNVFKNRTRPCLQYQIKRCSAPCVGTVSEEEYAGLVNQAERYLKGKSRELQEELRAEMERASAQMNFERASVLRDRIRALDQVQSQHVWHMQGVSDADIFAITRHAGQACVLVVILRGGQYYGMRSFFPNHRAEETDEAVLEAAIGQYYQRAEPPARLLLSISLGEAELLEEALLLRSSHKVTIESPQRGDKRKAIEAALSHAREALNKYLLSRTANVEHLKLLAAMLGLSESPERIEVYDNSHVSGTNAVGAMIVAGLEGFDKKAYRQFNIKSDLTPGDDYAMLKEVLSRRFKRMLEEDEKFPRPDVLIIDGGKGQLSATLEVMEQCGVSEIPVMAIAKGEDRNAGREWIHIPGRAEFQLPKDDALLHYLQRLRDEAHRYAIGTHRNRRSKSMTDSALNHIAGVGALRKRALLKHFGSVRELAAASVEQIIQIPGISKVQAEKIYAHFRE